MACLSRQVHELLLGMEACHDKPVQYEDLESVRGRQ